MKLDQSLRGGAFDFLNTAARGSRMLALLCLLAAAAPVLAQGVSGRIVGTATDSSGAAITNANVTVTTRTRESAPRP